MSEYITEWVAQPLDHECVREEIVRCRDCKRVTIDCGDHDYREPLWCSLFRTDVSLNGFCAWGRAQDGARRTKTE